MVALMSDVCQKHQEEEEETFTVGVLASVNRNPLFESKKRKINPITEEWTEKRD